MRPLRPVHVRRRRARREHEFSLFGSACCLHGDAVFGTNRRCHFHAPELPGHGHFDHLARSLREGISASHARRSWPPDKCPSTSYITRFSDRHSPVLSASHGPAAQTHLCTCRIDFHSVVNALPASFPSRIFAAPQHPPTSRIFGLSPATEQTASNARIPAQLARRGLTQPSRGPSQIRRGNFIPPCTPFRGARHGG